MHKNSVIISAGAFLAAFTLCISFVSAQSACVTITNNLQLESRDETTNGDVSKLQRFLSQQDPLIYPEKLVDGYYGPATRLAVYRWQKANNINATTPGNVDAKTRSALALCRRGLTYRATYAPAVSYASVSFGSNGCPIFNRTLSKGASGSDVQTLQSYLISKNLLSADSVTGYFGSMTERAIQGWQSSAGIVSSGDASTGFGVLGPRTRAALSQNCTLATTATPTETATPTSAIICLNTKPTYCQPGFIPGGPCNLQCVIDNSPPPQWVTDMLQNTPPQQQNSTADNPVVPPPSPSPTPPSPPAQQSLSSATITASPISGTPLTVRFTGTYDADSACDHAQFNLGYGDETSDTFDSACAPAQYAETHTYAGPGTYDAYIDKVTTVDGGQNFDTQAELLITIADDGSIQIEQVTDTTADASQANLAAVLVALESALRKFLASL